MEGTNLMFAVWKQMGFRGWTRVSTPSGRKTFIERSDVCSFHFPWQAAGVSCRLAIFMNKLVCTFQEPPKGVLCVRVCVRTRPHCAERASFLTSLVPHIFPLLKPVTHKPSLLAWSCTQTHLQPYGGCCETCCVMVMQMVWTGARWWECWGKVAQTNSFITIIEVESVSRGSSEGRKTPAGWKRLPVAPAQTPRVSKAEA